MKQANNAAKPCFRWAGGKQKIKDVISKDFSRSKLTGRYIEPFLGAGSIFFNGDFKNALLADINEELILAMQFIKDDPWALMEELDKWSKMTDKQGFYSVRKLDRTESDFVNLPKITRAARFLFLQRVGYNGVWRVNKNNQYNVSYGGKTKDQLYDEDIILACSKKLEGSIISLDSYSDTFKKTEAGDRIYIDPPYVPVNEGNFNYSKDGFSGEDQETIADQLNELDKKGVHFLLSNSHCPLTMDLYSKFNIKKIEARRSVGRNVNSRKVISEILVSNF